MADDLLVRLARLESIIDERDKLYASRFEASQTAVSAALTAQKELVAAAFLASEKAITKAEEAQREYNVRSNEFRGQLDDQAKQLMPRSETVTMIRSVEDKVRAASDDREKKFDAVTKEIAFLREQRMALVAERATSHDRRESTRGFLAIGISTLMALITIVTILLKLGASAAPPPYVPAPQGTTVPIMPVTPR